LFKEIVRSGFLWRTCIYRSARVLAVRSFEWLFLAGILESSWTVLKPHILPQGHKRLISGIQRIELFPLLSPARRPSMIADLRLYSLISTSRSFWEYCLLKASGFLRRNNKHTLFYIYIYIYIYIHNIYNIRSLNM